jgi:hypothetical protein
MIIDKLDRKSLTSLQIKNFNDEINLDDLKFVEVLIELLDSDQYSSFLLDFIKKEIKV